VLPPLHKILFLLFAAITGSFGLRGFYRLYRRIATGRRDTDARFDHLRQRVWYALVTSLTQSRTFRKRPVVSLMHSFIFYGFIFYLLVNLVDALDGFVSLPICCFSVAGAAYMLVSDVLSALVFVGVIALLSRRFLLPSRRDFTFNERTVLHSEVKQRYITRDSIFVSIFILFHVGSRAIGAGATVAAEGTDRFAPFATLLSHLFTPQNAFAWRIFGYWGALGSVLAFLVYFPYSKHVHIFMAPVKYLVARPVASGVLPSLLLDMEAESPQLGAKMLEDLAWPRLLDAYACIQCNRCQDVCPATATGKSLSPSALEINKRMELNQIASHQPGFERGETSGKPLLKFALSQEAAWACTTCGACIDVCPVGDEPMLDIIDIRRQQVMVEGEFPAPLQTAFRGMERSKNPWGINHEKRMDWADGLNIKITDENPEPDVLFWVGCAASYDPQSQKTARAFVQLLDHARVNFAVLGKRECCTGDSARRAGNEYLYRQLADTNIATLNEVRPKLIVATCPHCMNTVGKEYKQLGGEYKVMHHTEYLETLVASGKLVADAGHATVSYHDPCYLGRHNGVYDAPRNLLNILSNTVVELPRRKENSFCCGAGGAQFWKEEEEGSERISDNRYREAEQALSGADEKVLAVGCPFCKSMLESTPGKVTDAVAVRDIAELLLEGVQKRAVFLPAAVSAAEGEPTRVVATLDTTAQIRSKESDAVLPVSLETITVGTPATPRSTAEPKDLEKGITELVSRDTEADMSEMGTDSQTPTVHQRKPWPKKTVSPPMEVGAASLKPAPVSSAAKRSPACGAPNEVVEGLGGAMSSGTGSPSAVRENPDQSVAAEPVKRKTWKPKISGVATGPETDRSN
jgi:Fe-S oxidoreductase